MAAESESERLSVRLPPDLEAWLNEQASEHGIGREQLLGRLLEASRLALAEGEDPPDIDQLVARIDALDDELDEKIDDVRSRVVQVKREADAKAPADHDHKQFDRLTEIDEQLAELDEAVDAVEAALGELEGDIGGHDERLDTVEARVKQVAGAVVGLKRAMGDGSNDERLAELKRTAARRGVRTAECEHCRESVDMGMLTEPSCPYCDVTFGDLTGEGGLFSTPRLLGEE